MDAVYDYNGEEFKETLNVPHVELIAAHKVINRVNCYAFLSSLVLMCTCVCACVKCRKGDRKEVACF